MASTRVLRNATDAYVTSKRPKLNKANTNRLWISAGGDGNIQQAFLFFSLPFPMGSTVTDAKFRIRTSKAYTGTVAFTVSRVDEKWNAGKLNWDNKPTVITTGQVTVSKSNPAADTSWEFDLTSMMQTVSSSNKWWGLRIVVDTPTPKSVYSTQAASNMRPELEVTWTDAPEAPEDLSPRGGNAVHTALPVLSFDFTDDAGNTELNACEVEFSGANSGWTAINGFSAPSWSSGTRYVSEPELNLATITSPPSIAANTLVWWTVRVQDGSGKWSEWSDPESFKYVAPPTLTMSNPPSATPVVNDATPPIIWSLSGGTQTAYKVLVWETAYPETILWNSGKITSAETAVTIPAGVIKKDATQYHIALFVWDDVPRENNGTSKIWTRLDRDFSFVSVGAVAGVTGLTAVQTKPWPWVDITFSRSSAADEYNIWRDNQLIEANVPAAQLLVSGTSYSYRDKKAAPRIPHTWSVQAVVNSQASDKATTASLTTRLLAPMMMEMDSSNPVFFLNPNVDPQSLTMQERHQPINAAPVLITQFMGGFEGKLEGVFADEILPGFTARDMRNIFKKWKRTPGRSYILYLIDEVMTIVPYNMNWKPRAVSGGVIYQVSFDFFEAE